MQRNTNAEKTRGCTTNVRAKTQRPTQSTKHRGLWLGGYLLEPAVRPPPRRMRTKGGRAQDARA